MFILLSKQCLFSLSILESSVAPVPSGRTALLFSFLLLWSICSLS
uniref:Uncharacterized protein n=1 Tax=Arundo donax TaxID=35708 RepID=A0A0A8ZPH8_ARUDO